MERPCWILNCCAASSPSSRPAALPAPARRVHLTQSTLSQQMRRLEQQLGCTLPDRPAARW